MNHCCSLGTIFIMSESYDFLRSCKEIETDISYMWCSRRCGGNTSGAMEEIYANVQYAKPVDPSPSTNQTGKNVQLDRDIVHGCIYIYIYISSSSAYCWPYSLVFPVFRSQELREEISWICCSLSGAPQCLPAGWTHRPRCHLWVWFPTSGWTFRFSEAFSILDLYLTFTSCL